MPLVLRHSASSPSVRVAPYSYPSSSSGSRRRRGASDASNPNPRRVASDGCNSRRVLAEIEWWRVMQGQREDEENQNENEMAEDGAEEDGEDNLQVAGVDRVIVETDDESSALTPPTPELLSPTSVRAEDEDVIPFERRFGRHSRSSTSSSEDSDIPELPETSFPSISIVSPSSSSSSIFPSFPTSPSSSIFPSASTLHTTLESLLAESISSFTKPGAEVGTYTPALPRYSRSRATSLPEGCPTPVPPLSPQPSIFKGYAADEPHGIVFMTGDDEDDGM